jgi:ubiquinone/menaquinone biosynthesis C-methylase UbiE
MDTLFSEMNRVLKSGGKLVILDMKAASENGIRLKLFSYFATSIKNMIHSKFILNLLSQ